MAHVGLRDAGAVGEAVVRMPVVADAFLKFKNALENEGMHVEYVAINKDEFMRMASSMESVEFLKRFGPPIHDEMFVASIKVKIAEPQ